MLLIGSHVGFKRDTQLLGSLEEAMSYGATTFMFYTGAPQNTMRSNIDKQITKKAFEKMKQNNIDTTKIIVHAPYIVNLTNNKDQDKYQFSIRFLKEEVKRCEELGMKYLVLHPGSHVGLGVELGIKNIVEALNNILEDSSVTILLETMAGKGSEIGSNFKEIKKIITGVKSKEKIGVCMDTCHLNDAGYHVEDFDQLLTYFDEVVGINYLKCIHINDSKNERTSHKDRHENIGFGTIGFDSLIKIIYHEKLKKIPKILETPYIGKKAPYKEEIKMIKEKQFNPNMKEEIEKAG